MLTTCYCRFFGKEMHAIKQHLRLGETEQALPIFEGMRPLIKLLFAEPNPAATKAALSFCGIQAGSPRLPLSKASEPLVAELKEIVIPAKARDPDF